VVPPVTKVGSGSNLPGYYMYHGGSQPLGQLSSLQESQATGYWNDVPVISYDFQAAIGEYGQLREHYHGLRFLHLFLNDFGSLLAPMAPVLPDGLPNSLDDRHTLRWAARTDGSSGFVFINNYQRVESLPEHADVQLGLQLKDGKLDIPASPVRIASGAYMIWPFNLDMNGVILQYATAQLVCRLNDGDIPCYVFAALGNVRAEFAFEASTLATVDQVLLDENRFLRPIMEGSLVTLRSDQGQTVRLLLLSQEQARQCWKAEMWGQERLFLSPADLIFDGDSLTLHARRPGDFWFSVYPVPAHSLNVRGKVEGVFNRYELPVAGRNIALEIHKVKAAGPARRVNIGPLGVAQAPEEADFEAAETWEIQLPEYALEGLQELFLCLDYVGDVGRLYLDGRLMADDFYNGKAWEIGLKRFAPQVLEKKLVLKILPLHKDAPIYIAPEYRPDFNHADEALELRGVRLEGKYERQVTLK
jgi:beta-galactosidase